MRGIGMSPRDFEASINGSKTNLMKPPPPQSGHLNRAFNLLAADLRAAGATSLRAIAAGPNERGIPTTRWHMECDAGYARVGASVVRTPRCRQWRSMTRWCGPTVGPLNPSLPQSKRIGCLGATSIKPSCSAIGERSRGFLEGLIEAASDRLGALARDLLPECGQLLGLFAQPLELLSGVRCPQFRNIGRRLGGRELAGKLEGGLGVRMSHVDHLTIIVPHVFDRGRIASLNRLRRLLDCGFAFLKGLVSNRCALVGKLPALIVFAHGAHRAFL